MNKPTQVIPMKNRKQDWREEFGVLTSKLLDTVNAYGNLSDEKEWKPIGYVVNDIDNIRKFIESLLYEEREKTKVAVINAIERITQELPIEELLRRYAHTAKEGDKYVCRKCRYPTPCYDLQTLHLHYSLRHKNEKDN